MKTGRCQDLNLSFSRGVGCQGGACSRQHVDHLRGPAWHPAGHLRQNRGVRLYCYTVVASRPQGAQGKIVFD